MYNKDTKNEREVNRMNEKKMIISILKRAGVDYEICADGTLEIYGGGYDRSINLEFDEENKLVEIV